jgi:alanine dehydrogenase
MEAALLVGVPKEIKDHEGRVGLVPAAVRELVAHGHRVLVQEDVGRGAGIFDEDFRRVGPLWSTMPSRCGRPPISSSR